MGNEDFGGGALKLYVMVIKNSLECILKLWMETNKKFMRFHKYRTK